MATHMYSGWGVKFFDFDHDGALDLIVCNGHPDDLIESLSTTLTYREPVLLFHRVGHQFVNVGSKAGRPFEQMYPARGLAVGDLNNDGWPDVVIANTGEPPLVLQNTVASSNHWIGIAGLETGSIIEWSAGGRKWSRLKTAGGSYLSAHDPRELLSLGSADIMSSIEIRKPDGSRVRFENLEAGRYYTLSKSGKLR